MRPVRFTVEERPSDSPYVDRVWRSQSGEVGTFISVATANWSIVVTRQYGHVRVTVRGPETKPTHVLTPPDAAFTGIQFMPGAFMPQLPPGTLIDQAIDLPVSRGERFWLNGEWWRAPTYEDADFFVARMVRDRVLVWDPLVDVAWREEPSALSTRSVQRRFLRATGITARAVTQIERARLATLLLEQGNSILDTVSQAGYADQPHLTRSLRRFIGQTPAELTRQPVTRSLIFADSHHTS